MGHGHSHGHSHAPSEHAGSRNRWRLGVSFAMVAAFFVAIFPGNVAQYLNHADAFGLDTDTKRFVRLFFQPVLVAWALWSTEGWRAFVRTR